MTEHLYFFGGVDPAPSEAQRSDDGAIVISAARPRISDSQSRGPSGFSTAEADWHFDPVYARRFTAKEKASARQWSGNIHDLDSRFGIEKWVMDPAGGGIYIKRELVNTTQIINGHEQTVTPIGDQVDAPLRISHGKFNLHLWKRGDPGVEGLVPGLAGDDMLNDFLYSTVKEAMDRTVFGFTGPFHEWMSDRRDQLKGWPEERLWALKNLSALLEQLKNILVAMHLAGPLEGTYDFTARGARKFAAQGKKDFVSAFMYSYMAFLIWLRASAFNSSIREEDKAGFGGF